VNECVVSDETAFRDLQPTVLNPLARPAKFRSLRWKLILPLLTVIVPIAMAATYLITDSVARGIQETQINALIADARAVSERTVTLVAVQRREANRIAFTQGIADQVAAGNATTLSAPLRLLAAAGDLDYVIVGTDKGKEIVGLRRKSGGTDYEASQGVALDKLGFTAPILSGKQASASGIVRTNTGYALFTAVPVQKEKQIVGITVVGHTLEHVIQALRVGSRIALYGPDGEPLAADMAQIPAAPLTIAPPAITADNAIPIQDIQIGSSLYQTAFVPFVVDSNTLAVIELLQPNNTLTATSASRQLLSVAFSLLAGGIVVVAFVGVGLMLRRLGRVTQTAQALVSGDKSARTHMKATDEIGELGKAVDVYAQRMQKRQDSLELALRQQRRESAKLTAVIEALPDGIVVQDLDGRVVLMNDNALKLLGSERAFRNSPLNELTALVTDAIGVALAPGLYSLGDPRQVAFDGKVLQAQAAAILSGSQRVGSVIVLRDISQEVRREQARDVLLAEAAEKAAPLERPGSEGDTTMQIFVREVNKNAIALQRLITDIRDLSIVDAKALRADQQAISADKLLWNAAREWQPFVEAAQVELHVVILQHGLLVLGEERRLRWAIGNLIDNAVKYTLPRGHVTLTLRASDDDQQAQLSIKDTGVGISPADLPNVFTRFYRGHPVDRSGKVLQTPGTGQGLYVAKQIIEAHGGTIKLDSSMGRGTEIILTLPLTASMTLNLTEDDTVEADVPQVAPLEDGDE